MDDRPSMNPPGSAIPPASGRPSPAPAVKVAMDPEVGFSVRDYGGRTSYVAHHPRLGRFFRIGVEEYRVACLLDGQRTIAEVHAQITQEGMDWSGEDVAKFAGELVKQKLAVASSETPSKASPNEPAAPSSAETDSPGLLLHLPRVLSLMISQRFPLISGARIAKTGSAWIGFLFTRPGFLFWSFLVGSAMMIVYGNFDSFRHELLRLFDPGIWPILIGFWCVAKVIHEMGHAVCADRYGVRIGKMGVMFFLLAPLAYVDVTDAWKLRSRLQRVHIALGGVYLELLIASIAAWIWWYLPSGLGKHLAAQVFVVTGPTTLLVNGNPLLRLDGYYVLSDMLEIPNLRMHGRKQLGQLMEWILFSIKRSTPMLAGWRRPFATLHAACSVVFQFFWMGGLIIAASMWAKGLGIILAVAAFLLWGLIPFIKWCVKIWKLQPATFLGLNIYRRRLLGYLVLIAMGIQHLSMTSSPFDLRVPVVVRFQDEQISRASADAFVVGVYAKRGDRVSRGMILAELADPQLQVRRDQLFDDMEIAQQRAVLLRKRGDIAQATAEVENAHSLQRRLDELDEQLNELQIVAKRDGVITSNDPEKLLGRFVHIGDEIVRVSDPNDKEILAVIDERDIEAYQMAVKGNQNSDIRLRGGTLIRATPAAFRPRARRGLPHPALAGTVGGPIAVEAAPGKDDQLQMIQPGMESVTALDPVASAKVQAGQVGVMTISDNVPLFVRLYQDVISTYSPGP